MFLSLAVVLLSFVVANGTPERRASKAVMTCVVAGGAADDSSLEAAACVRGARHRQYGKG